MKKRKTGWIIALVVVICIGLAAGFWYAKNLQPKSDIDPVLVEAAIRQEYEAILNVPAENQDPFLSALLDGFEVEVQEILETEETVTAKCLLSNYNLEAVFQELSDVTMETPTEEFLRTLVNALYGTDKVSRECSILIQQNEDQSFTALLSEQDFDAATGGLITCYAALFEEGTK